jgi:hypothetical protein
MEVNMQALATTFVEAADAVAAHDYAKALELLIWRGSTDRQRQS